MKNDQGGLPPEGSRAYKIYKQVDMVTLPTNVEGTNCGNCLYFSRQFCSHPKIGVPVTNRMCCALWDNDGAIRYEKR